MGVGISFEFHLWVFFSSIMYLICEGEQGFAIFPLPLFPWKGVRGDGRSWWEVEGFERKLIFPRQKNIEFEKLCVCTGADFPWLSWTLSEYHSRNRNREMDR